MRVTNNMLVNTLLRNVNNNLQTMQKKQDQISTGKRVSAPSDDPVAISKILKYKTKINELEQYDVNAKDAMSWTQTSELAIADISNALNRARELAVQASTDSYSQNEREKIAQEIEQLKKHIIGNANKSYAGKYIFSSYQTDKKLLNEDGSFNINITKKELIEKPRTVYEVGVGETLEVSTNGVDIFGALELGSNIFANKFPVDENTGKLAKKAAIKGNFDLNADYTAGDNLDVTFNGVNYALDEVALNLDGSITSLTKEQVVVAFKNAKDVGMNNLSEVANVYFDENELVIESKDYVNDTISTGSAIFTPDPVHTSLTGTFDNTTDYSGAGNLEITYDDGVNSFNFNIDQTLLDGSLSNAEIVNIFETGENGLGEALSEYADVKYDGTDLVIQPIADGDVTMTSTQLGIYNPTVMQGKETIEAKVEGLDLINNSEVLSSSGNYEFTLIYNGESEKVSIDTSQLKSTEDLQVAIQDELNSLFGFNKLDVSIADGDVFRINTINSTNAGEVPSIKIDVPQVQENLFAERFPSEEAEGVAGKTSLIKGAFDLELDYTVPAEDLDVTFDGAVYTIDELALDLDGSIVPLTKEEVVDAFRNADNAGTKLSEVANIYYNSDNELVIQSKDRINIDIEMSSASFTPEAAYTSLKGAFDNSVDYSGAGNLEITYDDGVNSFTFDIDQTLLDSTLTDTEIQEVFENGINGLGEPLSNYANVSFDGTDLLIQPIEDKNVQMTSTQLGIYNPTLLDGKELIESEIIGSEIISDFDVESANGNYDFVMSYNNISERISIKMEDLTTVNDLESAIQSEIDQTFGLGNIAVELNDGDVLKLKTLNTPNDGSIPIMEFRPIKSNKPTMMEDLDNFINALKNNNREDIQGFITSVDNHLENVNASRSEIGAKTNRLEMILRRIGDDSINVTQLLSNSQDVDMAETIMLLKNAENVYKASLSAGARVIQPSLLDFLR